MPSRVRVRRQPQELEPDDYTRIRLRGTSRPAMYTTLPLQGREDLRTIIQAEDFTDEVGNAEWVYFYPAPDRDRVKFLRNLKQCDTIFNLYYKECVLKGLSVLPMSVSELFLTMRGSYEDAVIYMDQLRQASPYVFVRGFLHVNEESDRLGDMGTIDLLEGHLFELWYEHNIAVVTMGHVPPQDIAGGWSPNMASQMASRFTRSYTIVAKE